jgi:hypothetical protein
VLIGGLFLSFPAIFPATVTLKAAALDAASAAFAGWGMLCFGCAAWLALPEYPTALALSLAGVLWLIVSASLWWVRRHCTTELFRNGLLEHLPRVLLGGSFGFGHVRALPRPSGNRGDDPRRLRERLPARTRVNSAPK